MGELQWKHLVFFRKACGKLVSLADYGLINDMPEFKAKLPVIGNGLMVQKSVTVPNENGLFAKRTFATGEIITFYDGKIAPFVPASELKTCLVSHARSLIPLQFTILGNVTAEGIHFASQSGAHIGWGGGSFINHSDVVPNCYFWHIDNQSNEEGSPFRLSEKQRIVCMVASRPILDNEEILVDYGESFWKSSPVKKIRPFQ